ncbi:MarR family winged helix-turn-helix transcriptional regulator [Streptomyces sp. WMMC500]|uniref:MarR family winged helix-turn-helix transcriptional regulator n=1 Tax=Streptomyces sp. WMMC500 TaxID=3015154 RepID=UPI00248AD5E1|nr:MarR family winged helix-turn-helix transcriptional regulator [Streptomyces sp. WMMC500]WBB58136.1 MarR family winged helix-turn-helix transcriptional regulator [Streptomyces sp. WMMC500]
MAATTTQIALAAWESLLRAQATIAREFEYTGDWGDVLPREYAVLHALSASDDGRRITDLMQDALLTQAGVSRLVARLEKRGYVERRDDPADARACRVALSAAGRETYRRLGQAHARQVREVMTRALGTQELETLRELTEALIAADPGSPAPSSPSSPSSPSTRAQRRRSA